MANLGIGRWANQTFLDFHWESSHNFYDDLLPYYGSDGRCNLTRFMANSSWNTECDITFANDFRQFTNKDAGVDLSYAFYGLKNVKKLYLGNCQLKGCYSMLSGSSVTHFLLKEGCKGYFYNWMNGYAFIDANNLVEIGEFDASIMGSHKVGLLLNNLPKLKSVHIKHWTYSFTINNSNSFEEADLVEIISNLDPVTTTRTLTMGATNLAKLTDEEKQVATDKGWVLA